MGVSIEEIKNFVKDKRVIIVGNSGSLKGSGKGKQIEKYDVIIRMNHGTTQGWEKDVGIRTDIWFSSFHYRLRQLEDYNRMNPKYSVRNSGIKQTHDNLKKFVYYFPQDQRLAIKEKLIKRGLPGGKHPTTGFLCIFWIIEYIKGYSKLDITGFDFFKTHLNYFEPDSLKKKTAVAHRPDLEKPIIEELIKNNIIGNI